MDYINYWTVRAELPARRFLGWLAIGASKFHNWKERYGKVNEHNAQVPRDFWLEGWEQKAILDYHDGHPLEGYRRLTFMMLDDDVVAVSPSSTYRVLRNAGRLDRRWLAPSKKGTGFVQPLAPHDHWHIDVSYINVEGTFFYLCSLLDGYSRYIVHWEIRETMTERDVETIVQRALEKHPGQKPRIISDNSPQFIARDFKDFIRLTGMTHVRTSPITRSPTASWNAGTKASSPKAFGPSPRPVSRRPAGVSPRTSSITTTCGCIARSGTSHPRTNSTVWPR